MFLLCRQREFLFCSEFSVDRIYGKLALVQDTWSRLVDKRLAFSLVKPCSCVSTKGMQGVSVLSGQGELIGDGGLFADRKRQRIGD